MRQTEPQGENVKIPLKKKDMDYQQYRMTIDKDWNGSRNILRKRLSSFF